MILELLLLISHWLLKVKDWDRVFWAGLMKKNVQETQFFFAGFLLQTFIAGYAQPWKFVVITDRELAVKIGKAAAGIEMNKFAKDALSISFSCGRVGHHYCSGEKKDKLFLD